MAEQVVNELDKEIGIRGTGANGLATHRNVNCTRVHLMALCIDAPGADPAAFTEVESRVKRYGSARCGGRVAAGHNNTVANYRDAPG